MSKTYSSLKLIWITSSKDSVKSLMGSQLTTQFYLVSLMPKNKF